MEDGVSGCCHVPAPHHRPWCKNYDGPPTAECPLHGTMPAAHLCWNSPTDHACGVVLHPNYDPQVGLDDQGVTHAEWSRTQSDKLHAIAALHVQGEEDGHGGTSGFCAECSWAWPCRTAHWANGWGDYDDCAEEGWCSHASVKVPRLDDE